MFIDGRPENVSKARENDSVPIVIIDFYDPAREISKEEAGALGLAWVYGNIGRFAGYWKKYPYSFTIFDYSRKVWVTPTIIIKKISVYFENSSEFVYAVFQFEYTRKDIPGFAPISFSVQQKVFIHDYLDDSLNIRRETEVISIALTDGDVPQQTLVP